MAQEVKFQLTFPKLFCASDSLEVSKEDIKVLGVSISVPSEIFSDIMQNAGTQHLFRWRRE